MKEKLSASEQGAPKLIWKRCQCTSCGEYFSRERIFGRHRIGDHDRGVDVVITEAMANSLRGRVATAHNKIA